ncbi:MAG: hypothetical protein LBV19_03760 [Streptococcaceae bacterium]|jgi:hypothetical protein|nr:hypothetical protein [Streptococcaceae bacterium]
MKTYTYDETLYCFDVIVTGIVSLAAVPVFTVLAILNFFPILMILAAIVAFYSFWNCFAAKVHPRFIQIGAQDEKIVLESLSRKDIYFLNELEKFKIREFPSAGKIYLRINGAALKSRRYWINARNYNDGQELFRRLLDIEYKKHPDSLKAVARRTNTAFNSKFSNKRKRKMIKVK